MNRQVTGFLIALVLLVGIGMGYTFTHFHNELGKVEEDKKPVLGVEQKNNIIKEGTRIIYEKEYKRCQHVIIANFIEREKILGKTFDEVKHIYKPENGYTVSFREGTLTIHQTIEDWCPRDKEKCRLKEYQGRVAVYIGPDSENDTLLRVTGIEIRYLPVNVQVDLREGKYEFENEQALNDALENLDEFF